MRAVGALRRGYRTKRDDQASGQDAENPRCAAETYETIPQPDLNPIECAALAQGKIEKRHMSIESSGISLKNKVTFRFVRISQHIRWTRGIPVSDISLTRT